MRVDVVTIFPDYLAPLGLSLAGRAQAKGLLDVRVHDLRDWTHDRHRTVDDTPYGGGAGMVMKPEPWGEALDALAENGSTLVVPSPAGERFTQSIAAGLATRPHLVFACGRYEGIDQRVIDEASTRMEVRELSIGDFVLNGGEVAAMAIIEAVVRLLPGFVGNAASLEEESHAGQSWGGLLEHPVYTKPPSWRGHVVPPVLLSGDHARIGAWRREQSLRRTAARRPDLAHASQAVDIGGVPAEIRLATVGDAGELLTLQRACWIQEQQANPGVDIPPLHEDLDDVQTWLRGWTTLVLRSGGRLIGAVRGRRSADDWVIGRLMVAPDLQGRGIGRLLLARMEEAAPHDLTRYLLFTGAGSARNLRIYKKAGYRLLGEDPDLPGAVRLTKRRRLD